MSQLFFPLPFPEASKEWIIFMRQDFCFPIGAGLSCTNQFTRAVITMYECTETGLTNRGLLSSGFRDKEKSKVKAPAGLVPSEAWEVGSGLFLNSQLFAGNLWCSSSCRSITHHPPSSSHSVLLVCVSGSNFPLLQGYESYCIRAQPQGLVLT